ncbi:hypothetical protein Pcinc_000791 [Petrolisthes cinctipes]|uniref:SWIM-type domain-containing protein n=1 Tax=Petrolisthes cinctipes TaxID=88211 RepID=A0AAE1L3Q1_PETCI|nr:hypothetical protein Pcinc_000791 [Petrolisthes cinctipes]
MQSLASGKYQLKSQSDPTQTYEVDLTSGMCSCVQGENVALCKHQTACGEHSMTVVPQVFVLTSQSLQWMAVLAVGEEKAPKDTFFTNLSDGENKELRNKSEGIINDELIDKVDITNDNVGLMVTDDCENFNENAFEDNEAVMAKVQEVTQSILKAAA